MSHVRARRTSHHEPDPHPRRVVVTRAALGIMAACVFWCSAPVSAQPRAGTASTQVEVSARPQGNFWARVIDPKGPEYRAALEQVHAQLSAGKTDDLGPRLEQLQALKPDAPMTRYVLALYALQRRDFPGAQARLEALASEPELEGLERSLVVSDLALCLTYQEAYAEAERAWVKALGLLRLEQTGSRPSANVPLVQSNLAELLMARGELEQARSYYQRALLQDPAYVPGLLGMAMALERSGDRAGARGVLLRLAMLGPSALGVLDGAQVFTVPAEDAEFARGLFWEEVGQTERARRAFERFVALADARKHRYVETGRAALARTQTRGPALLAEGPLPLKDPRAMALDPKGRWAAFGDGIGRVVLVDMSSGRVLDAPLLGGAGVVDMAVDAGGERLRVAREDGYVRTLEVRNGRARLGASIGPLFSPYGMMLRKLTARGEAAILAHNNGHRWSMLPLDGTLAPPAPKTSGLSFVRGLAAKQTPTVRLESGQPLAVGPFQASSESALVVHRTSAGGLKLVRAGLRDHRAVETPALATSASAYATLALGPEGRYVALAGAEAALIVRASDLRVQRMISFAAEGALKRPEPVLAAFDPGGASASGQAALVVVDRKGWRAWRWETPR